jgi:hypothetical protein
MGLHSSISDGNRIFFQVSTPSAFLTTSILCNSSQCPVRLGKEVLDWCEWNIVTLRALMINFLLINNFATLTPCTAEALTLLSFKQIYYHSTHIPCKGYEWSGIEPSPPPPQKKEDNGVRTSAAQEIWLQNYCYSCELGVRKGDWRHMVVW